MPRVLMAKLGNGTSGKLQIADSPLGRGGEGAVFEVLKHQVPGLESPDSLVAKLYFEPFDRMEKVSVMVSSPPTSKDVAWPVAVLSDNSGFAGYVMRKLDNASYRPWSELSNTASRRVSSPDFDVKYAVVSCRNLASALSAVHRAGHIIGDVNESNIFVSSSATVMLIDCDSAQIADKASGRVFRCLVGKPEYTAPELSHGALGEQNRTVHSDAYALAVASYQMMTGGAHPTDGIYTVDEEPPTLVDRIRQGIMPNLDSRTASRYKFNSVPRIPTQAIPSRMLSAISKMLSIVPEERLLAGDFVTVLDDVIDNLVQCKKVHHHWFDRRDGKCGWCKHGVPDPWGTSPSGSQKKLPSIKFHKHDDKPVVRRASVTTGQQVLQSQVASQVPVPAGAVPHPYVPSKVRKDHGKVVLNYADGTSGPRPPLSELFENNQKMFWWCLAHETPRPLQFWWSSDRGISTPLMLIIATLAGLGTSWGVVRYVPRITVWTHFPHDSAVWLWVGEFLGFGGIAAITILFLTGIVQSFRNAQAPREDAWKTVAHFVSLPVFAVPAWLIGLFVGVTSWLIMLIRNDK